MFKVLRRGSSRFFLIVVLVLFLITVCIYYVGLSNSFSFATNSLSNSLALESHADLDLLPVRLSDVSLNRKFRWLEGESSISSRTCPVVRLAKSDVDTVEEFGKFNFQVSCMELILEVELGYVLLENISLYLSHSHFVKIQNSGGT